jgi:quinolinate synthase
MPLNAPPLQPRNDLHDELMQCIRALKKEKNALLLAHNYQRPEIYPVADFIGDSLELSRQAAATDAAVIVFCGVRFMAETAKILSPGKTVLLPNPGAGCSLADMVTPADVLRERKKHPGAAVVCYVNTSAAVKAASDVCCTSANAVHIVNALPQDEVIFLPDRNLGRYVQSKTHKKIHLWDGFCAVHQELSGEALAVYKTEHPGLKVIAHPECRQDILDAADHVCGTGGMARYAREENAGDFLVVTECGMANRLREDVPGKNFYGFCNFCSFMKSTTLGMVAHALFNETQRIELPEDILRNARIPIERMLAAA